MGIIGSILGRFGFGNPNKANPEVFHGLRNMVFSTNPQELGAVETDGPVWGLLMETGYEIGSFTLVALRDSTVSLYFANGGAMIGIGAHETPRKVAGELLAMAPEYLSETTITTDYPVPSAGLTKFYFLTFSGVRTVEGKEDDMGYNRHSLSPLFHKAHELIGMARELGGAP